ncbi:hypothetical protein ASF38_14795 [Aeromicrobium sp. Leaf272]|nr:hypothetical protein ASF38_14795 [Aeromicrobium sp. Leaf272]
MALVKGGLLVSTPRGEVPTETREMHQDLVLALIGLSSAMGPGDDEVNEHEDGWVMTHVPGEIGRSVVANQAFNAPLNERENWAVLQRCWRELPVELQDDPRVMDLEQEYANVVGIELEDLMAVSALAWAESLAGRSTFPIQLLETSFGFDAAKLARLVELISATPEQMCELVTKDAEKYGFEWSRRVFEERPAVLWPTGHLTIVDPDLVLNRSTGMWPMFDILRELEVRGDRKRINQVRGAVSHVHEIYAREVLDAIVGEGTERAYDEKVLQRAYRGKAADVALDYGEAWVIVEITTTGAQAATIAGSSDEAFMQDLDRYVDKLGQVMAVIDNLRADEKRLTGTASTVDKRFIPVLVVANTFVTSPITMTLLLERFQANYSPRHDVAEPTVLTLEDLHAIEGLQEQGGPSLLQLLEGRARSGLRHMAMKDYILLDLRRNPPPPERVRSRWPSWFEPARRRLAENQDEAGEPGTG